MKILQLCKYYFPKTGGIELVQEMMSKAHTEKGDSVHILSFGDKRENYRGRNNEEVNCLKTHLNFMSCPISFSFLSALNKILRQEEIDMVYVHLPNPFMHEVAKYLRYRLGKKLIIKGVYHADIVNKGIAGKIYNAYYRRQTSLYDEIICSSPNLVDSSNILSFSDEKKRIVPFCTKGEQVYKSDRKFNNKLLAIGRFVPYKGFEFLIDTLNDSEYELYLIGDGPLDQKLRSMASKNIHFLGQLSDEEKKYWVQECSCLVMSSISNAEAFGLTIAESFEAGMPVIASNLPTGVTYMVKNLDRGLVFEPRNSKQLLASLKRIASDPVLYQQFSKNSKEFFDENLSYDRFKARLMA